MRDDEKVRFIPLGPVLWRIWLSYSLQCQHPTWATLQVQAAPFLIQLCADVPGKALEDGPTAWAPPALSWQKREKLLAPGFSLAQPQLVLPYGE